MEKEGEQAKLFICYSREDEEIAQELLRHLKPLIKGTDLRLWDDTQIGLGEDWHSEIQQALLSTRVAVVLISKAFLASDYIRRYELPVLFQGTLSGVRIVPVFVGPSTVKGATYSFRDPATGRQHELSLTAFQGVNSPEKTLAEMSPTKRTRVLVTLAERVAEIQPSRPEPLAERLSVQLDTRSETFLPEHGASKPLGLLHRGWLYESGSPPNKHKIWFLRTQVANNGSLPAGNVKVCLVRLGRTADSQDTPAMQALRWSDRWQLWLEADGRINAGALPEAQNLNPGEPVMCDIGFHLDPVECPKAVGPFFPRTFYFSVGLLPSNLYSICDGDYLVHLRLHSDRFKPLDLEYALHLNMGATVAADRVRIHPEPM